MAEPQRFTAPLLQLQSHLPVYLLVPPAVVATFGSDQTFTVEAVVNGHSVGRRSISRDGEQWFMVLTKKHMEVLNAAVGDTLNFEVRETTQVPPDLQQQIAAAGLTDIWNSLTNADRRSFSEHIFEAKRPATRETRIARTIRRLRTKT